MILQPPFPNGTEGEAIISIGVLFFLTIMMFFVYLLMHYAYKIAKDFTLVVVAWFFSINFGFGLLVSPDFPFIPTIPLMFILWQTVMLILASVDFFKKRQRLKEND